ncbi:MAG: ParB/RepB/Spo0J family partition protein [Oscillospiraceae bacterium]|nr:ParB/RepB/Spo0J family partition protein [Oscillospiraceae bacterium]
MKLPFCVTPKEKVIAKVLNIPVERIKPNPNQPRHIFNADDIAALSASIEENGIIQPLSVRQTDYYYELVAGERRLIAAKSCGMEYVPCIIMDIDECESAVMALVENIQRKNLNFFEEAEAIFKMIQHYGLTQEEAAVRLGKTQSTVANKLRLLRLTEDERDKIMEYELTERHGRVLLKLEGNKRKEAIETIGKAKMNVERTEKYIEKLISENERNEKIRKRSGLFRHISLFANSINHAVDIMKAAGVECESKRVNGDKFVEFVIRVPTENMYE